MIHLADHIRPLLRDHDCVIIPDFGGLVADVSPARAQPGRQALSPPTKLVAFNQALTRNDGLLVDALSQHLGLSIAQARDAVRAAVAGLQQELAETNRTELPGIGIFRRAAGRGLAFEYTGTDNLLASAFGLPELVARPVRTNDARTKRLQPALRTATARRSRWARLVPAGAIAVVAGLFLLVNYQVALNAGYLPTSWQTQLPRLEWATSRATPAATVAEPQLATLAQHDFASGSVASEGMTPLAEAPTAPEVAVPVNAANSQPESSITPATTVDAPVASTTVAAAPAAAKAASVPAKTVATSEPVAKAPAVTKASVAATSSTTIKNRTGRYYVIAGAYRSLGGAQRGRQNLLKAGLPARIILPPVGSRLYRLTAADYPDLASAQREARRLRVTTRSDYNTLKF
ncbi:MAG TPA: SPOR domain-containing protein [Hymenobacter sp.]|jgi:cell division protein FtsN|uniref:HU domain-containing protein n=1 Tax=Hymenobacter sp. TaxID=1898978 RepID=UPI002ED9E641